MKTGVFLLCAGIAVLSAACSQQQTQSQQEIKIVDVDIFIKEHVQVNTITPIKAKVAYGDEPVEDAEVTFELVGDEGSEHIQAEMKDKGSYEIEKVFKKQGTYEIIAHTNAKGMHTMPKQTIKVQE